MTIRTGGITSAIPHPPPPSIPPPNPAQSCQSKRRFLLYSHDGEGLGHIRRNAAIANAIYELAPDAVVLLVCGTDQVHRLAIPPNAGVLKLPGLRKVANERYEGRHLRIPQPDMWDLRSSLLTAAVKSFRPDVVLADKHPLGVTGELRPALDRHRKMGGRTALGLRDILDERATVLREWAHYDLHERIGEYYDRVLVYGNQDVFDPIREYDFPAPLAEKTRFCGYVVTRHTLAVDVAKHLVKLVKHETRPLVLATAGGGDDGYSLLRTFIEAARGQAWDGIAITGPLARDGDLASLKQMAEEAGVALQTFVADLPQWFAVSDALVCMGGYNTLAEVVLTATPAVCVPRVLPRTEQHIRASAFARLGLVRLIEPSEFGVKRLRQEIGNSLTLGRPALGGHAETVIELNGATQAAIQLLELAEADPVCQRAQEIRIES